MPITTPFPEPDSSELERFALYGRQDIVGVLRELRDRQVLVTLYYDQAAGFAVSNVLDVNAAFEEAALGVEGQPKAGPEATSAAGHGSATPHADAATTLVHGGFVERVYARAVGDVIGAV